MRLRLGCELSYELAQPLPMIALLNVHYSLVPFLEEPDRLTTVPPVPVDTYRDDFGNWCNRLVAPAGAFTLRTDGVIRNDGAPDLCVAGASEHPVEMLPSETLGYLLGSRYCETDRLSEDAWRLFGAVQPGAARVQAICDFAHSHITFGYEHSSATRTAAETFADPRGVCRDFAHLAITLCRCLNIPARYCTGYISDIGQAPPYAPMDFAAWMEVFLDGQWRTYDPRNNSPRIGRVLIARGRDAADVPLTHTFGPNLLTGFQVWIHEEPIALIASSSSD